MKLCYFHLRQNILRRINNNYFKSLFKNNFWSKIIVFGAKALAFVPPEVFLPIWEELKYRSKIINDNFLNNFVEYFNKERIKGCDITYWNFYKDFNKTTNNFSESFNHKINILFNNKKTKLYSNIYNYNFL